MEEVQKKKILRKRVKEAYKAQLEAERKLAIANKTIYEQMQHIEKQWVSYVGTLTSTTHAKKVKI